MTGIAPRGAAALFCVGLGLILGVASPSTAPQALSFASSTGVVAASPSNASVLVDRGSGRFFRVKRQGTGTPRIAIADAIGDLNGDGRPDLVTHYNDDENDTCTQSDGVDVCTAYAYVSFGRRNGTFRQPRTVYMSDSVDVTSSAIGDVNGDGRPDILLGLNEEVNGVSGVAVLFNLGNGKFRPHIFRTPPYPVAVAVADLNGDGRPDIAIANGPHVDVRLNR
jgi:hypothetical protein